MPDQQATSAPAESRTKPPFEDRLRTLVRARHSVIWVVTHEEDRILKILSRIANASTPARHLYLWSHSKGLESINGKRTTVDADMLDPVVAIADFQARATGQGQDSEAGALFVMRDLHRKLDDGVVYRHLRDAVASLLATRCSIVITAPVANLPTELQKDVVVIDMPLPTAQELRDRVTPLLASSGVACTEEKLSYAVRAGMGMTEEEFAGAVRDTLVHKELDPAVILRAKEQIVRNSGILELYQGEESPKDIGGLDILKDWMVAAGRAFSDEAKAYGLKPRRGAFLVGPPGTGKSLSAKAAARAMGVPLLDLRADQIFGRYVGESEGKLRQALKTADAIQPCILKVDEMEKLLGTSAGENSNVDKRVLGMLLSWLQDHESAVMVVGTANDALAMDPAVLRRFDATFLVDLPNATERAQIFGIHLHKAKRDPSRFDLQLLAAETPGFSGSEIQQVISEALYMAFGVNREMDEADLISVIRATKPLSQSRKQEIEAMRTWAAANARPSSTPQPAKTAPVIEMEVA